MDIYIRTEIRHDWSYISAVALRIGDDILEVHAGGMHYLNGEADMLPNTVGGFPAIHTRHGKNWHKFIVDLGRDQGQIDIKSFAL